MIYPKIIALAFIVALLSCDNEKSQNRIIDAADYGLNESEDATTSILRAIEACQQLNASKLVVPKGKYHFYPEKAFQKYVAVSNNDNSLKRIAFPILNMKNFEVDGSGAEFIFHGNMTPFVIHDSENINLHNFSINWERTFHSQGTVVAVDETNSTFDIRIPEQYPYVMEGHQLMFTGEGWKQNIQENIWFDPKTKATVYDVTKYKLDAWNPLLHTRYGAREIEKGLVRVTDTIAKLPQPGWVWVVKGKLTPNRLSPGIHIFKSSGIQIHNINIHHSGAMGIIGERSENISLDKISVVLPDNTDRLVTTTADATHFVGCKGTISITNSIFENMLDDATNIHGAYTKVVDFPSENAVGVTLNHPQQYGYLFAEAGDSLSFINNNTLESVVQLKVKDVKVVNEEYMVLMFEDNLPKNVLVGFGVENITWYPEFVMKNCTVRQNRARSILISTRKRTIIENNFFSSMMAAISIGGDTNFWFESGAMTDLVIRNNTFVDCCTSGQNASVIKYEPNISDLKSQKERFHRNVLIENNTFRTFDRSILKVKSVSNLIFRNNHIEQTDTFDPLYPEKATVEIEAGQDIVIENNKYIGEKPADIQVDSLSRNVNITNPFL